MDYKHKQLELSFDLNEVNENKDKRTIFIDILLTCMLYIVLIFIVRSMFQLQKIHFVSMIPGLMFIVFLSIFNQRKRYKYLAFIGVILLFILFYPFIFQGLLTILNDVFYAIGIHTGVILPEYMITISTEKIPFVANSSWAYFTLAFSVLFYYLVKYNKVGISVLVVIGTFLLQIIFQLQAHYLLNIMLFFLCLLLIIKKENSRTYTISNVFQLSSLLMLVVYVTTVVALLFIYPSETYEKNKYINNVSNFIIAKIENARYEKNKTNSFTHGDFTRLSELEFHEEEALEIVMDKPTSLYLRGFIGSTYTSERWEELHEETYYTNHGLFYWLHDEGFYAFNQLHNIRNILELDQVGETVQMTINNKNANSKYIYTPYELSSHYTNTEVKPYSDSMLHSTKWFGDRLYSYEVNSDLVSTYPTLASELYERRDDDKLKKYFNHESHYNSYVYQTYTDLPEQIEQLFKNHFELANTEEDSHIAYEKAINFVKSHLNETSTYKINPEPLPEDRDFMVHFLQRTKEGYATHFATAATLMFRYLGIPARYIEGYLVTPADIENVQDFEKISVTGENAHAWTEIYMDEIGWIPVEVTPPYYHVMAPTDLSNYPKGNVQQEKDHLSTAGSSGGATEPTQKIKEKDSDQPKEKKGGNDSLSISKIVFIIVSMLFMITIGGAVGYFIHKRMKVRKRNRLFEQANIDNAIMSLFSYTMFLLRYEGIEGQGGSTNTYVPLIKNKYGSDYARKFQQVIQINQEAVFSEHQTTPQDYQFVYEFKEKTLKQIVKSKNIFQRMKMKYWECIY